MNLTNKVLILIIVVFLINHLTEGKIIETLKGYLAICQKNIEAFIGIDSEETLNAPNVPYARQLDFAYLNRNDIDNLDDETYNLYNFVNNLVTPNVNNYDLTKSDNDEYIADDTFKNDLVTHLNKIFNCRGYRFNNITLLDELIYFNNPRGKDIQPFTFKANVSYQGNPVGSVVLYVESFLRQDKYFSSKNGFLTITNIRLQDRTYPDNKNKEKVWYSAYKLKPTQMPNKSRKRQLNPTKNEKEAIREAVNLASKMNDSFNSQFVDRDNLDHLFIKPQETHKTDGFLNDTDNSLIPSIVDISNTYEQTSETESSS
jgi:hypothetical protein